MPQLFDLFGQGAGADPEIVGLPGGVYFGKDHVIRQSQSLGKFIHQSLGPGVSVGLEDAPELSVRVIKRGPQRCLDLCGVMRIVVDDCEAVPASQDLEAPLGSGIARQSCRCVLAVNAKAVCRSRCREGVVDIVLAGNSQSDRLPVNRSVSGARTECVRGTGELIVGDVLRPVIRAVVGTVENHSAVKAAGDLFIVRNLRIDDQGAVRGNKLGKFAERAADVVEILEEIQVIRVDIQNDADAREHIQETVRVLACFRGKILTVSDPDVSADAVEDASDGKGGIRSGCHHDLGDHGCRSCLSVGAADRDGILVSAHDLAQKNRPCYVRNSVFHNGDIFRIVRSDRCREDDEIDVGRDILLPLADNDSDAVRSQFIRNGRSGAVGSGDLKTSAAKDLRETAHGDSADP